MTNFIADTFHLSVPPAAVSHDAPDQKLLDLGKRYVELTAESRRAEAEHDRLGGPVLLARCDELSAQQFDVMKEILKTPPQTIAGLAVMLRVADCTLRWSVEDEEAEYIDGFMGAVLQEAERLAGMVRS